MGSTTSTEALARAQRERTITYRALVASPSPHGNTVLRRRLLRLSTRILRLRQQPGTALQEVGASEG
ncbi:hypothetical protein HY68_36320 [Streptomyces sp. AcH 505]|uniref:hypothetical protein n=1 Tax=Streptomyces sp. AcH 505 TaxID=352211 RepID=UPI000592069B|nr:hypothetical protein HY68_36320 [Streptomyces sp. AcH 505]